MMKSPDYGMQNEKLLDLGMLGGMKSPYWDKQQQQHTGHSGDHCCSHQRCYSGYPGQHAPEVPPLTQVRVGVGVGVGGGDWQPGGCCSGPLGYQRPGGVLRKVVSGLSHPLATRYSHPLTQWNHWPWLRGR